MRSKILRASTMALTIVERPGRGQDERRGAAGGVGRAADGDAAVCLLERGRVVHPVAGHRDDMAELLQAFDDLVLVLGEHAPETVGPLDGVTCVERDMVEVRVLLANTSPATSRCVPRPS